MINLFDDTHKFKSLTVGMSGGVVSASSDGREYQVNESFRSAVEDLTSRDGTSITHVSFSLGAAGHWAYDYMYQIYQDEGAEFCAPGSQLYKAFQALFDAVPRMQSIVLDIEGDYSKTPMIVNFSNMIGSLGRHVVPCPYTNKAFWQGILSKMDDPNTIQMIHLQAYDGGSANKPSNWKLDPIVTVNPGFSATTTQKSPDAVQHAMRLARDDAAANGVPLSGGWMWDYEGIQQTQSGTLKEYVDAIKNGMEA